MKDELVIYNKPKARISENIRTIRTNLQFTTNANKVLLVTSSIPGEGKSFISSNLAVAFAQTDEKVLLIDCDLRLGRLHKIFNVSNENGFSNLLATAINYDDFAQIKKTEIDNLYVLPRGVVPPNPSELLNSPNAKELFNIFRDNFDRIIVDGVPINGLPDSLIVSDLSDEVIIVCSAHYTKTDDLIETKKSLEKVGAKIAGVVVNKVTTTKNDRYDNYYK